MVSAPRAALGLPVPETTESPPSDQSALIGAPGLEHSIVGSVLSSIGLTTPPPISNTGTSSSLQGPSPTTSLTVSPAARLRATLLTTPGNLPQSPCLSSVADVPETGSHEHPSPYRPISAEPRTPAKSPCTNPAAHSTPPSSDPATPSTTGLKSPSTPAAALPSVQFGSAPDRVLTTVPPKSKTSRSNRTTKSRSVGRSVAGKQ